MGFVTESAFNHLMEPFRGCTVEALKATFITVNLAYLKRPIFYCNTTAEQMIAKSGLVQEAFKVLTTLCNQDRGRLHSEITIRKAFLSSGSTMPTKLLNDHIKFIKSEVLIALTVFSKEKKTTDQMLHWNWRTLIPTRNT